MRVLLVVAMTGLTVSACCGPLPDLPEVAFGPDGVASMNGKADGTGRKAMSLEEAVAELQSFHEAIVGDVTEGLCAEEVTASFEVMTVRSKGGSVKLALMPLSFRRGRERAATAGSTVTVTYRNPECPPVEVEASENTPAVAPRSNSRCRGAGPDGGKRGAKRG